MQVQGESSDARYLQIYRVLPQAGEIRFFTKIGEYSFLKKINVQQT